MYSGGGQRRRWNVPGSLKIKGEIAKIYDKWFMQPILPTN